jgi:hypothetical protein
MKIETIKMEREAAQRAFIEYRNAVRAKHSDEDAEIMRGYKALAKGQQLIKLSETIKAGGHMELQRGKNLEIVPRLACARASAEWCWVYTSTSGSVTFSEKQSIHHNARLSVVRLPVGTLPEMSWPQTTNGDFKAMVPPVPPRFRPNVALSNFHVLWEAEWQSCAPVDPALLRHIGGDLYAVLAVWDLTELERSVLMRRFQ